MRANVIKGVMVTFGLMATGAAVADPTGGSVQHFDRVLAHDVDVYRVTLNGGELTFIDVDGDGDTDLADLALLLGLFGEGC